MQENEMKYIEEQIEDVLGQMNNLYWKLYNLRSNRDYTDDEGKVEFYEEEDAIVCDFKKKAKDAFRLVYCYLENKGLLNYLKKFEDEYISPN